MALPPSEMGDWEAVRPHVLEALYALPDQVWFATPDLRRVLFSSKSFEELYGLPLDELYRDPASPLALTDSDDTGEIARAHRTGRTSRTPQEVQFTVHRPDGTERILRLRTIPLLDDDGRMHMLAGVTEDVTEQATATAEIARLNDLLTTILDATSDAITLVSADDRVRYVNRTLREIAGVGDGDVAGLPVDEVLPGRTDLLRQLTQDVIADGRPRSIAWHQPRADRWLETTLTPADGGVLVVTEDRTEQRQAEARERQWTEATHRAERLDALGQMAGSIAHDVGNLVRLVLSGLHEATESLQRGDDASAALADATHAAERSLAITHQLLAFSRGTEGPPHPVVLDAVISGMQPLVRRTMGDEIVVELDLGSDRARVESDEARLEQMLLNLITNARAAMPDGGRFTLMTRRRPADPETGRPSVVELIVADTGRGMTPDVAQRAFEPFFTTDDIRGTGLGLSTVLATAVAAGGGARIDSAAGVGTSVIVEMPIIDDHTAGTPDRLLLVDTFGPDSDATMDALAVAGHDVNRMTPSRIVAELDRNPRRYGLVVLDPLLDGGAGLALLRQLRSLHPAVPVVLLSGRTTHPELANDPVVHFVRPPYGQTELLRAVEHALGRT